MAAVCDVCGKGPIFGKSVSHSHVRTNRRWNPNIQRVRALVNGAPKRLNVCTSCLTAGMWTRNISPPRRRAVWWAATRGGAPLLTARRLASGVPDGARVPSPLQGGSLSGSLSAVEDGRSGADAALARN